MKTKSLLIAFLALSLASCKKEYVEPEQSDNRVVYGVECESCTFIFNSANNPVKRVKVVKYYQRVERNNIDTFYIRTLGKGLIRTFIKVNDTIIFRSEELNQDGQKNYTVTIPSGVGVGYKTPEFKQKEL